MSKDLKQMRQLLRAERCPASVLDQVYGEVSRQRRRQALIYLTWATAAIALLAAVSIPIARLSSQQEAKPVAVGELQLEREEKREARLAFALLGQTLKRATDQSRDIILEASLPRLRKGLRTAKEAMIPQQMNSNDTHTESNP